MLAVSASPQPALCGARCIRAPPSARGSAGHDAGRAGAYSGAYVANLSQGRDGLPLEGPTARILASNTKLFTTSAALARYGTDGTLGTEVLGRGHLDEDGILRGDLYLRGGGDPTFGSGRFNRRAYGGGASVEAPRQGARERPGSSA